MPILSFRTMMPLALPLSGSCGALDLPAQLPPLARADEIPPSAWLANGTTAPWVLHLRGSESEAARALAVAPDGSILVAGQFDADLPIGSDLGPWRHRLPPAARACSQVASSQQQPACQGELDARTAPSYPERRTVCTTRQEGAPGASFNKSRTVPPRRPNGRATAQAPNPGRR